MLIVGILH